MSNVQAISLKNKKSVSFVVMQNQFLKINQSNL